MDGPDNDRWLGEIKLEELGRHEYSVATWIDHFASWRRDLSIRRDENVVSDVDLHIGADLVAAAAARSSGADQARLELLSAALREPQTERAVATALSDELLTLMARYPDRRFESTWRPPLAVIVEPARARFGAWYELFPRSASAEAGVHGTFRDVIDRLEYVADLGFDVLYLPPVHPIGSAFRKGPNNTLEVGPLDPGVPWAIGSAEGGHTATHPQLGSLDDFDALVSAARARDIDIALDLAFQTSPDHPWVTEHRDWYKARPDGTIQYAENPPKKYQDAYPLDFESQDWRALWQELLSLVRFWIDHGVRIFRVDNPHTKPFAFWEWLIAEVKERDPEVLFLAEAFTRPKVMYRLAKLGFSQSYTYFTWRNDKPSLTSYFNEISQPPLNQFFRANLFTNTPDILHEYLQQGGRAAFQVRAVLAATLGASWGIYGPPFEQLEGVPLRPGSEEYLESEKYQLRHWDLERSDGIAPLIKQLNQLRREHAALQSDERLRFLDVDDDAVIAYSKHSADGSDVIVSIVNLDNTATRGGRVQLPLDDLGLSGSSYLASELLTGHEESRQLPHLEVSLDPGELPARIYHLSADTGAAAR